MNISFKQYHWRWTKNLILLFLGFLFLMTLARIGFSFFFGNFSELLKDPAFKSALWLGVRYDLIPLSYINALPFLLLNLAYFLPGKITIKGTRFLIIATLFIGYCVLGWLYICDYGFYSYFQDHINILFFGFFEDDTQALLISIWKNYNLPLWIGLIVVLHYAFWRILKVAFSPFDFDLKSKGSYLRTLSLLLVGIVFLAFTGRGTFNRLPLSLEDAHISSNEFINKLSLNGVLTLNRAIKIRKTFGKGEVNYLQRYGFENWQEAYEASFGQKPTSSLLLKNLTTKTPKNEQLAKNPPHVVLVVMESFGTYWNDKDGENLRLLGELGKHFKEDVLFKNFLSAENGTIGSIVSVATSQVIRPGARFLSESDYMKTFLRSSGHLPYKEAGYDTHFVYGGKLGWRDLGKYLHTQQYDNLWGADEIKESLPELGHIAKNDLGNEWGIFDEYLYTFIEEQIRTSTRPQFFLVLTTSNHPPFEYPSSYSPLKVDVNQELLDQLTVDKDLATKRFVGVQYANQKVGEFLSRIKTSSQKDEVVISLTGDHSYWIAKGVGLEQDFKRYAVPFYLYLPESMKPANYDKENFGSHEDIFPTLYGVTLSEASYIKLGEDMFREKSFAMNSSGLVANKEGSYHHGEFWKWSNLAQQELVRTDVTDELLKLKKHQEGLISITDLYLREEKSNKKTDEGSDPQE